MSTSAEARVIASFTFIVALLLGAWGAVDHQLTEASFLVLSEPEPARLVVALLPVAATAVALQATNTVESAWARTLGSATVMLGALSSLGGAVYLVASW